MKVLLKYLLVTLITCHNYSNLEVINKLQNHLPEKTLSSEFQKQAFTKVN